jgi:hypothetical protein
MKLNYKTLVASSLIIFSFLPLISSAEETAPKEQGFCNRVTTLQSKLADQIINAEKKLALNEESKSATVLKKEGDADVKRAEGRAKAEGTRALKWDKMISKAKTQAQKTAVEAYKKAIADAVSVRQASVDASVKVYREGLATLMTTQNTTATTAIATFKASIEGALAKAKTDCASGVENKTVSSVFNKTVSDARATLNTSRKTKNSEAFKTLKKTRDDAFKKAETDFKASLDKARADLIMGLK